MMFASMYSTRSHQQKVCTVNVIWTDHKYFYQVFKAIQVIPLAQIFLTIYIPVHGWAGYISYHPFKKKKITEMQQSLNAREGLLYKILTFWDGIKDWMNEMGFMNFYNWCSPSPGKCYTKSSKIGSIVSKKRSMMFKRPRRAISHVSDLKRRWLNKACNMPILGQIKCWKIKI